MPQIERARYVNPYTDFGFKRLFGEEVNKEILTRLMERPASLQERIFTRIFEAAEIANFTPEELFTYEESLKVYRDNKNVVDYAKDEARAEGELAKAKDIARKMLSKGMDKSLIVEFTGLSAEEISKL